MKHSIFIIFLFFFCFSSCASSGRGGKRSLPKELPVVLEELSSSLKRQIQTNRESSLPDRKNALKLAILPLLNENGSVTNLGSNISGQLLTQMNEPGKLILVEKSQLSRLIDEQTFQKSGLVLSDKSLEIGKLSGVDLVLLGSVQFNDQTFVLQLRVVSLQSGEILAIGDGVFDSNDALYDQYRILRQP
ncbi:FlgO family outer membrane protein [Leptospira stimsonii]|uniref:Penicillin-binding protein activator LpoB n=1 Tax=Leptospira stimsonii TaxID=2202203 RepID=A0ABY2N1I0_9LEPT|nr:FlgO family outer membrane protein [Leptospira stimsonii]TGK20449.1 penicillin-binding protein activator LpoB [Leptospira stimsonii]TGM14239.1 penicillin-binding protein activator LpoB [Leptospira stimsonii]